MGENFNSAGIWVNQDIKPRKYIVVSRKFDGVYAAACPCVGQIATNSKLLAYSLYYMLNGFAKRNLDNGYTIAVMLLRRVQSCDPTISDEYEAIER